MPKLKRYAPPLNIFARACGWPATAKLIPFRQALTKVLSCTSQLAGAVVSDVLLHMMEDGAAANTLLDRNCLLCVGGTGSCRIVFC